GEVLTSGGRRTARGTVRDSREGGLLGVARRWPTESSARLALADARAAGPPDVRPSPARASADFVAMARAPDALCPRIAFLVALGRERVLRRTPCSVLQPQDGSSRWNHCVDCRHRVSV